VTAGVALAIDTRYYRHMLDLTNGQDAGLGALLPRSANLEITTACQLACSHCPRQPGDDHLSPALARAAMAALQRAGVQFITLSYLGEPLLHPQLEEILADATRLFPQVAFVTNGLALDRERAELLLRFPLTRVGISLDDAHRVAAGATGWQAITANAAAFHRRCAALGAAAPALVVQSVLTTPPPAAAAVAAWLACADAVELRQEVPPHGLMPETEDCIACPLAFRQVVVRHDGRVQVCCADMAGELAVGTLTGELAPVWQGAAAWRLRRQLLTGDVPELCRHCAGVSRPARAAYQAAATALAAELPGWPIAEDEG